MDRVSTLIKSQRGTGYRCADDLDSRIPIPDKYSQFPYIYSQNNWDMVREFILKPNTIIRKYYVSESPPPDAIRDGKKWYSRVTYEEALKDKSPFGNYFLDSHPHVKERKKENRIFRGTVKDLNDALKTYSVNCGPGDTHGAQIRIEGLPLYQA